MREGGGCALLWSRVGSDVEGGVEVQAMSKPAAVHRFSCADAATGEDSDDESAHFISAVCWKSESPTMLAANSQGTIKVLAMAP